MWTKEMFGVEKPVIALLHLDALPGDPLYCGDLEKVVEDARKDAIALQNGGVDGLLIANEFSIPYQPVADIAVISTMAYIIGRIRDIIRVPFGVNVVKNPIATLDLAAATGAKFCRNAFSGAYMGEYGLFTVNMGEVIRHKKAMGLDDLKLFFKVNPEADTYLVPRDISVVTKSILNGGFAGALCVSGPAAGKEANNEILKTVHDIAMTKDVPVFCNTGCTYENVAEKFEICDGVCMGTWFKKDGQLYNHVDEDRVRMFMERVREIRQKG